MDYPIWPVIAVAIVGFASWGEQHSQNCTQQCINQPKPIESEDNAIAIIDKIRFAVNNQHKMVHWRRVVVTAIILAVIIILLLSWLAGQISMPRGYDVLIVAIFLFVIMYFSANSMSTYWWQYVDENIEAALLAYRHYLSDKTKPASTNHISWP